jgi:putative phosphoesterase
VLVAVISDTHMPRGTRRLPDRCVELLDSADLIVHAGDFSTVAVLRAIESHGSVAAVHGNVDEPALVRALPAQRTVEVEGARLAITHDAGTARGRLGRMRRAFPDADAVVFGHSHLPLHGRAPDGFQIFNPGSPTERRRAPCHSMGLAHIEAGAIEFELVPLS